MTGIFEINELNLKGQFCFLGLRYYCQAKGLKFENFASKLFIQNGEKTEVDFFELIDLMYYSCKAYATLQHQNFELTIDEFTNEFAKVKAESLPQFATKLVELELFGNDLTNASQTNSKKKLKAKA